MGRPEELAQENRHELSLDKRELELFLAADLCRLCDAVMILRKSFRKFPLPLEEYQAPFHSFMHVHGSFTLTDILHENLWQQMGANALQIEASGDPFGFAICGHQASSSFHRQGRSSGSN